MRLEVTHCAHLFDGGVIRVQYASLDQALGQIKHLGEVIRCVGYRPPEFEAQPLHVSDDGIDILRVLLHTSAQQQHQHSRTDFTRACSKQIALMNREHACNTQRQSAVSTARQQCRPYDYTTNMYYTATQSMIMTGAHPKTCNITVCSCRREAAQNVAEQEDRPWRHWCHQSGWPCGRHAEWLCGS